MVKLRHRKVLINYFNIQVSLLGIDEHRLVAGLCLSFGY